MAGPSSNPKSNTSAALAVPPVPLSTVSLTVEDFHDPERLVSLLNKINTDQTQVLNNFIQMFGFPPAPSMPGLPSTAPVVDLRSLSMARLQSTQLSGGGAGIGTSATSATSTNGTGTGTGAGTGTSGGGAGAVPGAATTTANAPESLTRLSRVSSPMLTRMDAMAEDLGASGPVPAVAETVTVSAPPRVPTVASSTPQIPGYVPTPSPPTVAAFTNSASTIAESQVIGLVADLAACEKLAHKGQPNGYAGLDATGKVPISELPTIGTPFFEQLSSVDGIHWTLSHTPLAEPILVPVLPADYGGGGMYSSVMIPGAGYTRAGAAVTTAELIPSLTICAWYNY